MSAFLRCSLPVLAAGALCAALAFYGLGNHAFWDDEANTAIFARNLLRFGELTAWDGTNLIGFRSGAELDRDLRNTYMPPLPYWITAASFSLFGEGTASARAPFVLAGVLTVLLLGFVAGTLAPGTSAHWVGPWLLACSPAFLLYIRNCRYYALSAVLLVGLLAVFLAAAVPKRLPWLLPLTAALVALLWQNHYFSAVYAVAMLPLFALHPRFRSRGHLAVTAVAFVASAAMGAFIALTRNPFAAGVAEPDPHPVWERVATLAWWHARDLGTFEFVPVALLLVLPLPFVVRRLEAQRPAALLGLLVAAAIVLSSLLTAALSPQPLDQSNVADMRHQVAVIPLGALFAALCLRILFAWRRPAAVVAALLVVVTNIPHLGFAGQRSGMLPRRGVECTLGQYVYELTHDYQTSTEALIEWMKGLPAATTVLVYPPYMAYSPMFYVPTVRYCCQLDNGKALSDEAKRALPAYVFWETAPVSWAFISADPPAQSTGPLDIKFRGQTYDLGQYTIVDYRDIFREDRSRPEIPWHTFDPADFESVPYRGFFVATVERE